MQRYENAMHGKKLQIAVKSPPFTEFDFFFVSHDRSYLVQYSKYFLTSTTTASKYIPNPESASIEIHPFQTLLH